jgi:hypothetical protein
MKEEKERRREWIKWWGMELGVRGESREKNNEKEGSNELRNEGRKKWKNKKERNEGRREGKQDGITSWREKWMKARGNEWKKKGRGRKERRMEEIKESENIGIWGKITERKGKRIENERNSVGGGVHVEKKSVEYLRTLQQLHDRLEL